jgi:hypothetical protein
MALVLRQRHFALVGKKTYLDYAKCDGLTGMSIHQGSNPSVHGCPNHDGDHFIFLRVQLYGRKSEKAVSADGLLATASF